MPDRSTWSASQPSALCPIRQYPVALLDDVLIPQVRRKCRPIGRIDVISPPPQA
jgi:hypothetical protein